LSAEEDNKQQRRKGVSHAGNSRSAERDKEEQK